MTDAAFFRYAVLPPILQRRQVACRRVYAPYDAAMLDMMSIFALCHFKELMQPPYMMRSDAAAAADG